MMEAKRPISCLSFTQAYSLLSYPRHLDGMCDRRQCVRLATNPFKSASHQHRDFMALGGRHPNHPLARQPMSIMYASHCAQAPLFQASQNYAS